MKENNKQVINTENQTSDIDKKIKEIGATKDQVNKKMIYNG
jgi:hypothetical protein